MKMRAKSIPAELFFTPGLDGQGTGVHLIVWPGVMIMVTVLCFYLLGDGLRDALDPSLQQ